jgi:tetratricopeptide (TPR) repeat protein
MELMKGIGDLHSIAVIQGDLGDLAMKEGDLVEAGRLHQVSLTLYNKIKDISGEATAHHQLGIIFQQTNKLDLAEHHYRESAVLEEKRNNIGGAAQTWNQLGTLCRISGRLEASEAWYRKAIEGGKLVGNILSVTKAINNFASLLLHLPGRLVEAHQLAEEALAISQTLDAEVTEIWGTYRILAQIADRQSRPEAATDYRRLALEARRRFAGTTNEFKRFAPVIAMVAGAVADHPLAKAATDELIRQFTEAGGEGAEFAHAIEHILGGERDPEALCQRLSEPFYSLIVEAILQAQEDPSILNALLSEAGDES